MVDLRDSGSRWWGRSAFGLLSRLFSVLAVPGAARAVATWRPPSLASFQVLSALVPAAGDLKTIIDAGANVGQFARAATMTFPEAAIYCFEPLPGAAEELKRNLRDRPQVKVVQTALASADGVATLYPNEYSQASSLLHLRKEGGPLLPGLRELEPIQVRTARLDSLLAGEGLRRPILLKLDLQGYEVEALRGAPETLRKTEYVVVEIAFDASYEGEPTFETVSELLVKESFHFERVLNFDRDRRGSIFQMDALFVRAGT